MSLTIPELKAAIAAARRYPPGFGDVYIAGTGLFEARSACERLQSQPYLVERG